MLHNQLWDNRRSFIEPVIAFLKCSSYLMKLLNSNKVDICTAVISCGCCPNNRKSLPRRFGVECNSIQPEWFQLLSQQSGPTPLDLSHGKWLAAIGPGHPLIKGICHPKQGGCITTCCGLTLPGVGVARDPTLLGRVTLVYRVGVA